MVGIQTNTVLPYCCSLFYQYELLTWKHDRSGEMIHWNVIEQENSATHCGFTYFHCTLSYCVQENTFCLELEESSIHAVGVSVKWERAVNCTTVLFPFVTMLSFYWCKTLPPLKLGLHICSILVREICSSFGTRNTRNISRGFPAEPYSNALALF